MMTTDDYTNSTCEINDYNIYSLCQITGGQYTLNYHIFVLMIKQKKQLYRYNTKTKQAHIIKYDMDSVYTVTNKYIYGLHNNNVRIKSLDTPYESPHNLKQFDKITFGNDVCIAEVGDKISVYKIQ